MTSTASPALMLYCLAASTVFLLGGCDHKRIHIQAPAEVVVITKLPIHLAIRFEEQLMDSHFNDETQPKGLRNIALGEAHANMFRRVLGALFASVYEDTGEGVLPNQTQLVIDVRLKNFQFSTPKQSHAPNCEAWISYELALSTPANQSVSTPLNLNAYGSASVSSGRSYPYYVRLALNRAIRDAGAQLIATLPNHAKIIHIVEASLSGNTGL